jgi:protein gp37
MGDRTGIEWTGATWNPVVGCSLASPGCSHCYAMGQAARIERMTPGSHYAGTTMQSHEVTVWNGVIKAAPDHILTAPMRWKRPRDIFVNSMGDLFHENAPDELIDRVFAVMVLAPQHRFQMLTKRDKRMRDYLRKIRHEGGITDAQGIIEERAQELALDRGLLDRHNRGQWPLPNVMLGVTIEDQRRADERRAVLSELAGDGWRTFVSYEPALGLVDWRGWEFIDWLISGGESGPRARPSHPAWHRAARDFCAAQSIPYFFKQWGEWIVALDREREDPDWRRDYSGEFSDNGKRRWLNLAGGRGFHGEEFCVMDRVGKRTAGSTLDGVEHKAMPARVAA